MSEEQIQTICDDAKVITDNDNKMIRCHINIKNFDWLIEQTERVQELKEHLRIANQYVKKEREINTKLKQQNKELLEGLATIGNAIHEGEISGRGTNENLILEIVDKHWRNRNEHNQTTNIKHYI